MQVKPTRKQLLETTMSALGLATAALLVFGPWSIEQAPAGPEPALESPATTEAGAEAGGVEPHGLARVRGGRDL